jgi:hypothetical protein
MKALGSTTAAVALLMLFVQALFAESGWPICRVGNKDYDQVGCVHKIEDDWKHTPPPIYEPTTADEAEAIYWWALDDSDHSRPVSECTAVGGAGPLLRDDLKATCAEEDGPTATATAVETPTQEPSPTNSPEPTTTSPPTNTPTATQTVTPPTATATATATPGPTGALTVRWLPLVYNCIYGSHSGYGDCSN